MEKNRIETFSGTISPIGWGSDEKVKMLSLYTGEGEDIVLKHKKGNTRLLPYINKTVRLSGIIISNDDEGRTMLVKKIARYIPSKVKIKATSNEIALPAA